jgi:hypothetical protein
MWSHFHPESGMWDFVLVTEPMEYLWVVTERGIKVTKGTKLEGYRALLGIGDRVFFRARKIKRGPRWNLKFRLTLYQNRPSIRYGYNYGPRRGLYNCLRRLSGDAFENAGIDPAWIKGAP